MSRKLNKFYETYCLDEFELDVQMNELYAMIRKKIQKNEKLKI